MRGVSGARERASLAYRHGRTHKQRPARLHRQPRGERACGVPLRRGFLRDGMAADCAADCGISNRIAVDLDLARQL